MQKVQFSSFLILLSLSSASAYAKGDWGCEVLLCMSNPDGPMAVAECVGPISKLWRELAKGKPFPSCIKAESAGSYVRENYAYYDDCPAGYEVLPQGIAAIKSSSAVNENADVQFYRNSEPHYAGDRPDKVCVKGLVGSNAMDIYAEEEASGLRRYQQVNVQMYEDIALVPPLENPHVIDVYIDGQLARRVPVGGR